MRIKTQLFQLVLSEKELNLGKAYGDIIGNLAANLMVTDGTGWPEFKERLMEVLAHNS